MLVRGRDIREMRRRHEEIIYIFERGYEPLELYGSSYWIKRHWGSLHTRVGALADIRRNDLQSRCTGKLREGARR
jgi:hypothetical protein